MGFDFWLVQYLWGEKTSRNPSSFLLSYFQDFSCLVHAAHLSLEYNRIGFHFVPKEEKELNLEENHCQQVQLWQMCRMGEGRSKRWRYDRYTRGWYSFYSLPRNIIKNPNISINHVRNAIWRFKTFLRCLLALDESDNNFLSLIMLSLCCLK